MDLPFLINLCRYGWAIPILAALGGGIPPRFHALKHHLAGASREAILDGVGHLIDLGLLERTTGRGHPMRPDFHLTASGQKLTEMAAQIWQQAGVTQTQKFVRLRWGLPLLGVLDAPLGFGDIRGRLPPITDRALSLILKQGQVFGLVDRAVMTDTYPPATLYSPLKKANPLHLLIAA